VVDQARLFESPIKGEDLTYRHQSELGTDGLMDVCDGPHAIDEVPGFEARISLLQQLLL
jgi:hypothetical protein